MGEFHLGPWTTAVGDGEIVTEIRLPLKAGRRQRAREGRAARGRLGDRGRVARRVWIDGDTIADAGIALSAVGLTTIEPHARRGAAARRRRRPTTLFEQAGAIASEDCIADPRRPRTGRLQAPPRGRAHQTRAAQARRPAHSSRRLRHLSITINGETVTRDVEPRTLLVHFIRDTPGLTGTHWGCDTSNCGACVVLMDGKPLKSCTALAAMCEGHEIRTVESLEVDGVLDPIQQGFHECHALQCGFCTPGMLMTTRALLDENPDPTEHEIRTAISGAICRCTGYKNIVAAVRWAAEHQEAPR